MEYTTIWGTKDGKSGGRFVELGYDREDNHVLIYLMCDNKCTVYHFILAHEILYKDFVVFAEKWFEDCEFFDDIMNAFETLVDEAIYEYVDDYPEPELPQMRTEEEIDEYMSEAHDRVWLVRAKNILYDTASYRANGKTTMQLNRIAKCIEEVDRVCKKYNINFDEPVSDWDYGYWSGILAALRWVCGDEKDFLDT